MTDTTLVLTAAAFASRKHSTQRRKDAAASPYINHPLELARLLADEGGVTDVVTLCAALLHDTVEDTDTTLDELTALFGAEVASVVAEVTDDTTLPKADRKAAQVAHAAHISRRAQLVKLADKISNLRDVATSPPDRWTLERRQEYFDWGKSVVDQMRGTHPVLEALFDSTFMLRPL
jgi:GTP diphosphokinase / guanosine-3',5'-bis(diphosphate) 3'-diphosphatase